MANEKRLIDANKLTAVMRNLADHVTETHPVIAATMLTAIDVVAEQKTVDAVEVVRCKDCQYYEDAPYYVTHEIGKKICRSPNLDYDTECGDQWMWMTPNDFCSCGVRRCDK